MADFQNLGALLGQSGAIPNPAPTTAAPTGGGSAGVPTSPIKQQWDSWFQDPVNKAGLLSFGLNMLAGGWGSGAQRFAHAVGQGIESAAGVEALQEQQRHEAEAQGLKERELTQTAQLEREKIQARKDIAKTYADQRRETAGLGGVSGALTRQERQAWDREVAAFKEAHEFDDIEPEELEAAAVDAADRLIAARRSRFGAGKTSSNLPAPGASVSQPLESEAPGKTSPNSISYEDAKKLPGVDLKKLERLHATPAGREILRKNGIVD